MPREFKPPLLFDVSATVEKLRKLPVKVDGVTINFPFLKVSVKADRTESKVAKEIVIRLADRRVLNASECCDNCIENALRSLQEIRKIIVDKEVELSDHADGVLYILLDSIRESIRQFLTFEQRLQNRQGQRDRELYFAGLEILRGHIHRTLLQISKIAKIAIPGIVDHMRYDENWQLNAYRQLNH